MFSFGTTEGMGEAADILNHQYGIFFPPSRKVSFHRYLCRTLDVMEKK